MRYHIPPAIMENIFLNLNLRKGKHVITPGSGIKFSLTKKN